MDLCPVCGAYWACDHGEPEPEPEPNYVDLSYVQFGETVHGYDLRVDTRDTEASAGLLE